jgi:predicted membrane protein
MGFDDKDRRGLDQEIRDRIARDMKRRDRYSGVVPGAVILAIGLIFLLSNFGIFRAIHFWQFWPVILIFAGIAKLFDPARRAWGVILLILGILLQLNGLGIGKFTWGQLWPLLLIAAGAMAMWSAIQARRMTEKLHDDGGDLRTTLNENAIFGGVEKRLNGKEFRGGQLQSIFGGIEIDLRDADIAESEAVLYANAIFGGIEIRVPDNWFVAARGQGIFGGFSDSTRYNVPVTDTDKPKKTLIVMGMAVFGGVEIRN